MAYSGYLLKIKGVTGSESYGDDYAIPLDAIAWESYKATYSVLDKDSKRNGTGRLKRATYKHKVAHCTFTLLPMKDTNLWTILNNIKSRYVKKRQKKVKASIWVPEINSYVEDYFYIPDTEYNVLKIENGHVFYTTTDVELIGY